MPTLAAHASDERRLAGWILLACVLLWACMAAPFFAGRVYVADDLGAYHLPLRSFYAEQLARGAAFDWLPQLYNGFYLTGEGQLGAYHPLHLLLYRLLPLGAAFDLELLLSYPLMMAGTYCLLERLLQRRDAALFGGLAFTFSGFNLLHFVHPNAVAIVAHIPWLLWALDILLTTSQPPARQRACALIALLTGSQWLLGYPQYVWFSLLAEAAYAVSRCRQLNGNGCRIAGLLIFAKICGLLIGGIQLLPTLAALASSTRAVARVEFANSGSLAPGNVLQLFAPYLFATRVVGQNTHELGLYVGSVPLALAVWLAANRRLWGRWRPLIVGTTVLGGLALLLAFGEQGPLYRLQQWLPLVNRFRFPCRAIVLFQLAFAVLAAVAFLLLGQASPAAGPRQSRGRLWPWCAVALSMLVALLAPALWPEFVATAVLCWAGPLLLAVATLLVLAAAGPVRGWHQSAARVLLVLLTAVDLGAYGLSYAIWPQSMPLEQFAAAPPLPPAGLAPVVAETAQQRAAHLHAGNRLLLAGFRRADGYAGLEPARQLDYSLPAALRLAGVAWRAAEPGQTNNDAPDPAEQWIAVANPLERIRLVTRAIVAASPDAIPAAALRADTAMVERPLAIGPGMPGSVDPAVCEAGHFELLTRADSRQLLIVTESFDPGWQATVDGQPVPILRVNHDFMGCLVGPGHHRVVLRFRPASLRQGAMCTSLGLGLMVGLLAWGPWVARRRAVCPTTAVPT